MGHRSPAGLLLRSGQLVTETAVDSGIATVPAEKHFGAPCGLVSQVSHCWELNSLNLIIFTGQ